MARLARPEPGPPAPAPTDDHDLGAILAQAAGGDDDAWRQLVDRYARRVHALARSRLRREDLAEEITQSVFATIAIKLAEGGYEEKGRFEAWLFRVAMNRVRDEARRGGRQAGPVDPAQLDESPNHDSPSGADPEELAALRQAITHLSDGDREVVELRHHGQMSFKTIAQYLGEPVGTVLARHHRALRKLRDLLDTTSGGNPSHPSATRQASP